MRMAEQQERKRHSTAKRFRAAWDARRLDEAAEILRLLANNVTDGYGRLTEERAAKLALKPTKAIKQFFALCEDEGTLKILLTSPPALAHHHPTLAFNMSRLVASAAHFPKPTETLVNCGALDVLANFVRALPVFIDLATKAPPYDGPSLTIAGNLILTVDMLLKSKQAGFKSQLLRAGALDALLDSAPFQDGLPGDLSHFERLATSALEFVSAAVYLCMDLSFARRLHKGEGIELSSKTVDWSLSLLELVCKILEGPGDKAPLGDLPQGCLNGILGLLHLVGQGFPGAFDFRPSIRRAAPHLERFPEDGAQTRSILEGLERASKAGAAGGKPDAAEPRLFFFTDPPPVGFVSFGVMQEAFASSLENAQRRALAELATFCHKRKLDPEYRQADLHARGSLFPIVPQLLGLLEARSPSDLEDGGTLMTTTLFVLSELIATEGARQEKLSGVPPEAEQVEKAGRRLLTWLKLHHSMVRGRSLLFEALTAVGHCARATWASLGAILNAGGFLVFCKEWFEANASRVTLEGTEDFALCLLTPLQVPRGVKVVADQTAVAEAVTGDGMLTWVFERAGRAAVFTVEKRPNLLPLLALCSALNIDFSAFLTPDLVRLFVRQLERNWRGACRAAALPTFEKDDVMLRSMGDEFNRLAGHVRIVEATLCGGRRDAGGKWDPGYLADVRAAVADGARARRPAAATFMAFFEADGVAVFASIVEARARLERFRVRAEREGFLLPEAADVARRVELVWELVAGAFNLHRCANLACSHVENQKGTFKMCGGCKLARYCSEGCQKAHWRAGHKREGQTSR